MDKYFWNAVYTYVLLGGYLLYKYPLLFILLLLTISDKFCGYILKIIKWCIDITKLKILIKLSNLLERNSNKLLGYSFKINKCKDY